MVLQVVEFSMRTSGTNRMQDKWFSERSDHSLISRRPYSPTGDGWQPRQRRRFCFVPRDTVNHHAGSYTTWPPTLFTPISHEIQQCRRYTSNPKSRSTYTCMARVLRYFLFFFYLVLTFYVIFDRLSYS
jgi:hypothetical protein